MLYYKHQIWFGIFAVFMFILITIMIFKTNHNKFEFYVTFKEIDNIEIGTPVMFGSQKIGEVTEITYNQQNKIQPVKLRLSILHKYASEIYENSIIGMSSFSLIGKNHIYIQQPNSDKPAQTIKKGTEIKGQDNFSPAYFINNSQKLLNEHKDLLLTIKNKSLNIKTKFEKLFKIRQKQNISTLPYIIRIKYHFNKIKKSQKTIQRLKQLQIEYKQYNLEHKINYINALTTKFNQKFQSEFRKLEHKIKKLKYPKLMLKISKIKQKMDTSLKKLNIPLENSLKTLNLALSNKSTLGALMQDKEIFDDLKEMIKKTKNNFLDLLFKRNDKTLN